VLRETAVQLETLGHQSLALALEEGTDRLGGPAAPPSKANREALKKKVAISTRAVARTRPAVALRCLSNAEQEIRIGLEAEPGRPELKALQTRVQKDLEEAEKKVADADRMRKAHKGMPHALTALDMGFMSEMLSIFSIIVGIALLLTGIGVVILAKAVFGRRRTDAQAASSAPTPATAPG
jgi:hypothetical protein